MNEMFKNGAMVHRVWEEAGTDFLAVFQYYGDAKAFAKAKASADQGLPKPYHYTATCMYSGDMEVYRVSETDHE